MAVHVDPEEHFVQNFRGGKVGIDGSGRLYTPRTAMEKARHFFAGPDRAVITERVSEATDRLLHRIELHEAPAADLAQLVEHLVGGELLRPATKTRLLEAYYEDYYQQRRRTHGSVMLAEVETTLQMRFDKRLPEEIRARLKPEAISSGASGVYKVKNRSGEVIAILKPRMEEQKMPRNPKGSAAPWDPEHPVMDSVYAGFEQGMGYRKEVAASLLDEEHIFSVPETREISLDFQGTLFEGSVQQFVVGEAVDTLEAEAFYRLPVKEVQKLVLLDLLIANGDRNVGNALLREGVLHPIDHAQCFSDALSSRKSAETMCSSFLSHFAFLEQTAAPLDEGLKAWILAADSERLKERIRRAHLSPTSLEEFTIRFFAVQEGVKRGHTLQQVARFSSYGEETIEECCKRARGLPEPPPYVERAKAEIRAVYERRG